MLTHSAHETYRVHAKIRVHAPYIQCTECRSMAEMCIAVDSSAFGETRPAAAPGGVSSLLKATAAHGERLHLSLDGFATPSIEMIQTSLQSAQAVRSIHLSRVHGSGCILYTHVYYIHMPAHMPIVYACLYTCLHTCLHTFLHACLHTCLYTSAQLHTCHAHAQPHVSSYIHAHVYTHVCACLCTLPRTCLQMGLTDECFGALLSCLPNLDTLEVPGNKLGTASVQRLENAGLSLDALDMYQRMS